MRKRISDQLKQATKDQEKRRLATLRLITAAIKDRDIAARSDGRERIDDEEILQVLQKMVKQRKEAVKTYEEAGRLQLAQQEQEEIGIIEDFLPEQMNEQAVHLAALEAITKTGAEGLRDMGKIMGHLKTTYSGRMDFGLASKIVKEILN